MLLRQAPAAFTFNVALHDVHNLRGALHNARCTERGGDRLLSLPLPHFAFLSACGRRVRVCVCAHAHVCVACVRVRTCVLHVVMQALACGNDDENENDADENDPSFYAVDRNIVAAIDGMTAAMPHGVFVTIFAGTVLDALLRSGADAFLSEDDLRRAAKRDSAVAKQLVEELDAVPSLRAACECCATPHVHPCTGLACWRAV